MGESFSLGVITQPLIFFMKKQPLPPPPNYFLHEEAPHFSAGACLLLTSRFKTQFKHLLNIYLVQITWLKRKGERQLLLIFLQLPVL